MKLLFIGDSGCNENTLKRLLVLSDEIGFMDVPAVAFNICDSDGELLRAWGIAGHPSPFRRFKLPNGPVELSCHAPPSGPDLDLYNEYFRVDLSSAEFRRVFWEGMRDDDVFVSKVIQLDGQYISGTGADVRAALLTDHNLVSLDLLDDYHPEKAYEIGSAEGRKETVKSLLQNLSIALTSAMVVSETTGLVPVTDDVVFSRLLATRNTHPSYIGGTSSVAPFLGMEVARSVLPDAALTRLTIEDIVEYRAKAKDVYTAWSAELNAFAAKLDDVDMAQAQQAIPKLIATEVVPRTLAFRREMISCRDELFGDLVRSVTRWQVPSLSIAHLAGLTLSDAITVFVATSAPALRAVVDFVQARRATRRNHAIAYLVGLKEAARE